MKRIFKWWIFELEYFHKRAAFGIGLDENTTNNPKNCVNICLFGFQLNIAIKPFRYIYRETRLHPQAQFSVSQLPHYPSFDMVIDYSEQPVLIDVQFLWWVASLQIYKNKNEIY